MPGHYHIETYPRPPVKVPGWLRQAIEGVESASQPTRSALLGFEEQRDLARRIADLLASRAPADRDQIRAFYRAAGDHEELIGHILSIDGQLREWEAPRELLDHYRQLRSGMYKDGIGTWTAASTVVEWPLRTSVNYLFSEDPQWRQPPPRTAVLNELEMFPRAPEHVPDWMKTVLPNAERVAEVAPRFRHARIFDQRDANGRPALTGEVPATPAPRAPADLSDRDRRVLALIERRVSEAGATPEAYRILGSTEGATCLERVGDEWQVASYERGKPRDPKRFIQLWDAGVHLLGTLTLNPSSRQAGGGDRNTAPALNDWPIQPLPGEPPLTLLTEKHIAVLMPGRQIIRYGPPTGNLTFAAETEFAAMSLRRAREQQGPRRFRVVRELRTPSGRTGPWHDQSGGGTAYLLARSVEQHADDGSLSPET